MNLLIKRCSYKLAKYATINFHYSKRMPAGRLVKYGVWENSKFIGVVLYGKGANNNIGKPYGLKHNEVCELVRVALREHTVETTRIIAITLRLLKKENAGLLKVVSYADITNQNHEGVIYRAGNWLYEGIKTQSGVNYKIDGIPTSGRSLKNKRWDYLQSKYGDRIEKVIEQKHKFVYNL